MDPVPGNSLEPIRGAQRSARLGVAMTAVVPGWGQLYADSPFWGVVAFGVQMFYVGSIVMEGQRMDRARVDRDRFEPGTDYSKPRTDRKLVEWASQTTIHNDGILLHKDVT